jgi:hypothetical protein
MMDKSEKRGFVPKSVIRFTPIELGPGRETSHWLVEKVNGTPITLGMIWWDSPARCYVFFPKPDTFYEKTSLRDIADFCECKTETQRRKDKAQAG